MNSGDVFDAVITRRCGEPGSPGGDDIRDGVANFADLNIVLGIFGRAC